MSRTIGQYYYRYRNGAGGRIKLTPGFEDFDKVFCSRGAFSEGGFAPPALLYAPVGERYFVGREEVRETEEGTEGIRHGFLFPKELFEKNVFGAKLYRFFDIDDFDCTAAGFEREETLSPCTQLHVAGDSCDFLRPESVFRQCREHTRFVKLLFYAAMMAITEPFSIVFSLPEVAENSYHRQAVLMLRSLMAMMPWEFREHLSFHSCVEDRYALGSFKLSVTPYAVSDLPRSNKLFYFDMKNFRVSPDLVIEQKTRGTLTGDLIYLIWSYEDEKALSSLFYIVHHNRELLSKDALSMVEIDALTCFFLLTEVGEKYRERLADEISRLSKGTCREIVLFLAGHLGNREFVKLRDMLNI